MKIRVKVKPNSRIENIKQLGPDNYEIKVSVPPEKGKANKKVIEILSKYLNIPKSRFNIIKGETNKEKLIEILA